MMRDDRGFTLVEVLAVTVILGILAAVVVPNISQSAKIAKVKAFATTLATVQAASDQFFSATSVYPTYPGPAMGGQPVAGVDAAQIDCTACDLDSVGFLPGYIRMIPEDNPANLNLDGAAGSKVYYGVTADGKVFATQEAPEGGKWTRGETVVYTQESAQAVDPDGRPGSTSLNAVASIPNSTP